MVPSTDSKIRLGLKLESAKHTSLLRDGFDCGSQKFYGASLQLENF
jgi:hypothetical protein